MKTIAKSNYLRLGYYFSLGIIGCNFVLYMETKLCLGDRHGFKSGNSLFAYARARLHTITGH